MSDGFRETNWGYEIAWIKATDYCGKILCFHDAGSKTAMYFHKERTKSWFVNSGQFTARWIDTETAQIYEKTLAEGSVHTVNPMVPHQLESLVPGAMIFEVSNKDDQGDTFKIGPGDI